MTQKHIDQEIRLPNGKFGVDAYDAFAIVNENAQDAEQRLSVLEAQDVEALKAGLQQEAQLRADADTAEANARQNADAALGARIAGKNLLINGDFRIWQRGTNFTTPGYTADRWTFNFGGVASGNVWRNTVSPGQFPGVYADALARVSYGNITNNAAHFVVFEQHIEGCDTAAGQTVAISFWVYNSGAAGRQVAIEFRQGFGSGGSTVVDSIGMKKFALPAGMSYVTHSVTLPSVTGKQRGANDSLAFTLWCSAGSQWDSRSDSLGPQVGDLHFTEVQVEVGGTATGFERRHPATELALCQRYYEKSYNLSAAPGNAPDRSGEGTFFMYGQASSAYSTGHTVYFRVRKRTTPALVLYSTQTGAAGKAYSAAPSQDVSANVETVGSSGAFISMGPVTTNNINLHYHWTADAEI